MSIEDIVKEIPFQLDLDKYKTKEQFFEAFNEHLNIVATKAEYLGYEDLTEAIDTMRNYLARIDSLSKTEEEKWKQANETISSYTHRYSDDGREEEQMLKDEINCACMDVKKAYDDYLKACNEARNLEMTYREKYGEPSGRISEDFLYE